MSVFPARDNPQLKIEIYQVLCYNVTGHAQEEIMQNGKKLPLDERYRLAEGYPQETTSLLEEEELETEDGTCPYHEAFIYECCYCNPD